MRLWARTTQSHLVYIATTSRARGVLNDLCIYQNRSVSPLVLINELSSRYSYGGHLTPYILLYANNERKAQMFIVYTLASKQT